MAGVLTSVGDFAPLGDCLPGLRVALPAPRCRLNGLRLPPEVLGAPAPDPLLPRGLVARCRRNGLRRVRVGEAGTASAGAVSPDLADRAARRRLMT